MLGRLRLFKIHLISITSVFIIGCTSVQAKPDHNQCVGNTKPPSLFSNSLQPIDDPELLIKALGKPLTGSLCQGRVYEVTEDFIISRAWNSTNENSKFGSWWAFKKPTGLISKYRKNSEICYQWSPLDTLISCTIIKGSKIVIGTGQSAKCSDYLQYPTSKTKQIYIDQSTIKNALINCTTMKENFTWVN